LNQILILSDNQQFITFCTSILNAQYQVDSLSDMTTEITADITIVDADKIPQNEFSLSLFANKATRFFILGNDWSDDKQIDALVHGAAGYSNKSVPPTLLLQAIERLLKGDIWIQRHLVSKVIGTLIQKKAPVAVTNIEQKKIKSSKLLLTLSNREREVAHMIRSGDSNKSIASTLFISERTVKAHLTSIFKKLKIPDRLHLALLIKESD